MDPASAAMLAGVGIAAAGASIGSYFNTKTLFKGASDLVPLGALSGVKNAVSEAVDEFSAIDTAYNPPSNRDSAGNLLSAVQLRNVHRAARNADVAAGIVPEANMARPNDNSSMPPGDLSAAQVTAADAKYAAWVAANKPAKYRMNSSGFLVPTDAYKNFSDDYNARNRIVQVGRVHGLGQGAMRNLNAAVRRGHIQVQRGQGVMQPAQPGLPINIHGLDDDDVLPVEDAAIIVQAHPVIPNVPGVLQPENNRVVHAGIPVVEDRPAGRVRMPFERDPIRVDNTNRVMMPSSELVSGGEMIDVHEFHDVPVSLKARIWSDTKRVSRLNFFGLPRFDDTSQRLDNNIEAVHNSPAIHQAIQNKVWNCWTNSPEGANGHQFHPIAGGFTLANPHDGVTQWGALLNYGARVAVSEIMSLYSTTRSKRVNLLVAGKSNANENFSRWLSYPTYAGEDGAEPFFSFAAPGLRSNERIGTVVFGKYLYMKLCFFPALYRNAYCNGTFAAEPFGSLLGGASATQFSGTQISSVNVPTSHRFMLLLIGSNDGLSAAPLDMTSAAEILENPNDISSPTLLSAVGRFEVLYDVHVEGDETRMIHRVDHSLQLKGRMFSYGPDGTPTGLHVMGVYMTCAMNVPLVYTYGTLRLLSVCGAEHTSQQGVDGFTVSPVDIQPGYMRCSSSFAFSDQ